MGNDKPNGNGKNGNSNGHGKKFLFISEIGCVGDLAYQVQSEGSKVRYCVLDKYEKTVSDGFVEKVDDWEKSVDWADIIVFDDIGFGSAAEKLRREGKAVVGGTPLSDKLEFDRDFGQEELKKAGINTLPYWDFSSFDEAIKFVKANPGRYVIKPNGKAQNDKVLSFVGQEEDGLDILNMLERYKKGWGNKIRRFQIKKFVSGVEVAIGAF
ncbi:phosphoribosylamine--glycine ligase, partial [bacterium F11]